MARVIGRIESRALPLARSLRAVWTLRLALGLTALFGSSLFLLGTSWDIQWHEYIGRDRTLIPPHQIMLVGVGLSGLSGLTVILIETLWARRSTIVEKNSTRFAEFFRGSLGAYIVGFAALNAAVAFPLDAYWHALYGIDVAIWAPFHIMFAFGMSVVALGAAYMLASAANLASSAGAVAAKRAAYIGVIVALATMMSIFTLLLFDALGTRNAINLGIMRLSVFPLLAGLLVACTFVAAVYAAPWRWAATSVVIVYLFFAGIMAIFVQPATDYLLMLERLSYRSAHPFTSIVTLEWFLAPIVVAILIDVFFGLARRRNWSSRRLFVVLALIALIAGLPMPIIFPIYPLLLLQRLGIAAFVISLLLGLLVQTHATSSTIERGGS